MGKDEIAELVAKVNEIIKEYEGMKLTLRQLFYRAVAAKLIPNTKSAYQRLGKILVKARLNGDVAFTAMEDRTRKVEAGDEILYTPANYFNSYYNYLKNLDEYYKFPKWWGQPKKVAVFVEKEALSSLFRQVTVAEGVSLVCCRGYASLTLLYETAKALRIRGKDGKYLDVHILYAGDFDASGMNIEEKVAERLKDDFNVKLTIERIAITKEQIDKYNISPAPGKKTDPRHAQFVAREGVDWQIELDAIEPRTLQEIVRKAIRKHFNDDLKVERDRELARRRKHIRRWINEALDPDFENPDDDEEDEDDE